MAVYIHQNNNNNSSNDEEGEEEGEKNISSDNNDCLKWFKQLEDYQEPNYYRVDRIAYPHLQSMFDK